MGLGFAFGGSSVVCVMVVVLWLVSVVCRLPLFGGLYGVFVGVKVVAVVV